MVWSWQVAGDERQKTQEFLAWVDRNPRHAEYVFAFWDKFLKVPPGSSEEVFDASKVLADFITQGQFANPTPSMSKPKKKRKPSAYNKAYAKEFKKLAPKYKKKNGQWKKNGFKNCCKECHKCCRKKVKKK